MNPYGIDYLLNTYNILTSEAYMGLQNKYVNAYVSLWPYLKDIGIAFLSYRVTAWIMTLMIFSIFSLSIYELVKKRSCDFALLIASLRIILERDGDRPGKLLFPHCLFLRFFLSADSPVETEEYSRQRQLSFLCWFFFSFLSIFPILP